MKFTTTMAAVALLLSSSVQGQELGPYPKAYPDCAGNTELVTIDMSSDGSGRSLGDGDSPNTLPEDITVSAKPNGDADLVVFDTGGRGRGRGRGRGSNPTPTEEGFEEFDEGGVLIIGAEEGADADKPEESAGGGRVLFRFRKPIYQLTNIRMLSVNKTEESFITGLDSRGRRLDTFVVPTRGENNDTTVDPSDWYDVRLLEIVLGGVGGISELMITVCRGNLQEMCPPGARLTRGGFCRPCPEGTFLSDNVCTVCEGNSVSPIEGSETCIPCDDDDSPLGNKKGCRRRCPRGQFRDENGVCLPCPFGHVRALKDKVCSPCPEGLIPNEVGNRCVDPNSPRRVVSEASSRPGSRRACQPGSFVQGRGRSRTCTPCPEDTISTEAGSKTCFPCANGLVSNEEQTDCVVPQPEITISAPQA